MTARKAERLGWIPRRAIPASVTDARQPMARGPQASTHTIVPLEPLAQLERQAMTEGIAADGDA